MQYLTSNRAQRASLLDFTSDIGESMSARQLQCVQRWPTIHQVKAASAHPSAGSAGVCSLQAAVSAVCSLVAAAVSIPVRSLPAAHFRHPQDWHTCWAQQYGLRTPLRTCAHAWPWLQGELTEGAPHLQSVDVVSADMTCAHALVEMTQLLNKSMVDRRRSLAKLAWT